MVHDVAKYKFFSTIDLKSAYHQIPIHPDDKPFTAFEAVGGELSTLSSRRKNSVASLRISMILPFAAARKWNFTFNKDKTFFAMTKLRVLGYEIENGKIRPDPTRLQPLLDMPVPRDKKSLQRALGLFAYYSQWIPNYSSKVRPLIGISAFPLPNEAQKAFQKIKSDIEKSAVHSIDESLPFEVETDASDVAIAAVLNQLGRPVAFFSRALQPHERRYAAVEKEAHAIIEAIRHWRHYLTGQHFTIKTDQRSVRFMFDKHHKNFDIVHRPGKDNIPPDVLSRACCRMVTQDWRQLKLLHEGLCHPGVTRMYHFVRSKNLPYSLDEIRALIKHCRVCAECKPVFYKPPNGTVIKATQPFERLNLDFKGPLPGDSASRFLLCIVDEYSRFPFAIPCPDTSSASVIRALTELFSLFGSPAYVHSDRGAAFMSREVKDFLTSRGIACSRTTAYNPQGNGQAERYVGVIWKTIMLALESRGLPIHHWRNVLPEALSSLRTLLCTATNTTPHERMFVFDRRCAPEISLPEWLRRPGPVLLKKQVRASKTDPLVERVELLEANPQYAHVRSHDGRETTVSIRHLAPSGAICEDEAGSPTTAQTQAPPDTAEGVVQIPGPPDNAQDAVPISAPPDTAKDALRSRTPEVSDCVPTLRRSTRLRRPPKRLDL
uniref:Integrase catalytic domain-containing protein n=1 Tax=Trichuris muris TaxID=70415 RepID=A0A5S6R240_TRIMR